MLLSINIRFKDTIIIIYTMDQMSVRRVKEVCSLWQTPPTLLFPSAPAHYFPCFGSLSPLHKWNKNPLIMSSNRSHLTCLFLDTVWPSSLLPSRRSERLYLAGTLLKVESQWECDRLLAPLYLTARRQTWITHWFRSVCRILLALQVKRLCIGIYW